MGDHEAAATAVVDQLDAPQSFNNWYVLPRLGNPHNWAEYPFVRCQNNKM